MKNSETHGWFSKNAKEALKSGEMPYDMWSVKHMLNVLSETMKDSDDYNPEYYDLAAFDGIDKRVIKETLLRKSSWHHVNGNCVWFYSVVQKPITHEVIGRMYNESKTAQKNESHPRLVYVMQTQWETSTTGHQFARQKKHIAVCYQGNAYFLDGGKQRLRDGKCVEAKSAGKIVKENRKIFDKIVKQMRTNYAINI